MTKDAKEIIISLIAVTIVLTLLVIFIISFAFLFQRRQAQFRQERETMRENYQRELLQSQIEIQNHTLQQIAQELHDNIGQLLTVVVMRLNALEDNIGQPDSQQSVQQTRDLVRTVISDVRTLSKTLDHDTVQRFGLLSSLTLELERIERTGRIQTKLVTSGEVYSLGEQAEIVLLRMAQESINNALKHAQAHTLTVFADFKPDDFVLTIADDGTGFNVEEASARTLENAGAGLNNLNRRTGLLGGTCTVNSRLGEGTRIQIQLPRKRIS